MSAPNASEEMRAGRRSLDGLVGVELVEDWQWLPEVGRWTLLLRLTVDLGESDRIPASTDWHFAVDSQYPLGDIWVSPAKTNGIKVTFHHQRCNRSSQPAVPWRRGNICVDIGVRGLDRSVHNQEPWSATRRLEWYVRRALAWLAAAAKDELMLDGEPFELPDFPLGPDSEFTVAFNEDATTFASWQAIRKRVGYFEYSEPPAIRHASLVQRFLTNGNKVLLEAPWSQTYQLRQPTLKRGVWIRLPQLPVVEPWQAPTTWGELEAACARVGVNLLPLLEQASHLVRDGKRHVGLLGFPLPRNTGEESVQMHWQAFVFPALAYGHEHPRGFRPLPKNQWWLDRRQALSPSSLIEWLESANWSANEISARGRLPQNVRSASFAVIGVGALGSAIAELLARAGVGELLLIDCDTLKVGNLVRHTLTMSDLEKKADAMAARLVGVSPNVQVDFMSGKFPPVLESDLERVRRVDVIVDTTGSDEVISALAAQEWIGPKLVISASLSLGARRIYIFSAYAEHFPAAEFHRLVNPLLERDVGEWKAAGLPWEGVGCWNPVFPARIDDIWLLASATIKEIQATVSTPSAEHHFSVIEQVESKDGFGGLRKVQHRPRANHLQAAIR